MWAAQQALNPALDVYHRNNSLTIGLDLSHLEVALGCDLQDSCHSLLRSGAQGGATETGV